MAEAHLKIILQGTDAEYKALITKYNSDQYTKEDKREDEWLDMNKLNKEQQKRWRERLREVNKILIENAEERSIRLTGEVTETFYKL